MRVVAGPATDFFRTITDWKDGPDLHPSIENMLSWRTVVEGELSGRFLHTLKQAEEQEYIADIDLLIAQMALGGS